MKAGSSSKALRALAIVVAGICLSSAGATVSAASAASDLNLLVTHDISETGVDGVTRTLHFQERVYRRDRMIWIERVLPAAVQEPHAAAAMKEPGSTQGHDHHKHLDPARAALWVTLDDGKSLKVRLVDTQEKVVIDVPAAEYGSIGFEGSWETAWHLLDPRSLKDMQLSVAAPGRGLRWYESISAGRVVRVLWDEGAAIPRRVLSDDRSGLAKKRMSAKDIAPPRAAPWALLDGYQRKEYSDYLD